MHYIDRLCSLLLFFLVFTPVHSQSGESAFVRLATYWDAPGTVAAISPDNRYITIYDEVTDITRLVEVSTGQVQAEREGVNSIRFSPNGQFLVLHNRGAGTLRIVQTSTQRIIVDSILSYYPAFSSDGRFIAQTLYHEVDQTTITQVVDAQHGQVLFEVPGLNPAFSPDGSLLVIFYQGDMTTVIHELPSGRLLKAIPVTGTYDKALSNTPFASYQFSPDSRVLALYQHFNLTTHLVDVATWNTMYSVEGFIQFNRNRDYLAVRYTDWASSPMELIETMTGEVLYEVSGAISFSQDGKLAYLYEFETYEDKTVQVVELSTGRVLTEQRGWISLQLVENNQLIEIHDEKIGNTRYVELETGETRWEFDGNAGMFDDQRHLALVDESKIVDVPSGNVLVEGQRVQISSDGRYIFVKNGLLVDLYGAPELRVDTMPEPRP